jgi:hypothetical protein
MMVDWGNGWFLGDVAGHLTPNSYGGEYGFNAKNLSPVTSFPLHALSTRQAARLAIMRSNGHG